MNWAAMAVSMVVPFFLTPFVVRSLGAVAYGVWILAVSTVAYLGLLDLGLRSAIIRFVSKADVQGNIEEAQSAIGTALWFRLLISGVVAVLSVVLALIFPHLFKVPSEMQRAGQITVLLCALGVAITLSSGVFGAVLSAINRFDILSSITMGQTLARAVGVILILRSGHGLVALAYWEFAIILLSGLVTWGAAAKIYPLCRVRINWPDMTMLKRIWSYSFTTFLIIIAVQIVFYTDNIVIGAFLSVGMVTFYSIAGSLALYSGQVASAMGTTFIPLASGLDASGRSDDLQRLLVRGTQAALGLVLPICTALLLRGKTFIGLWMGPQYSEISGTILQILIVSQFFTIANSTAGQIAYGIDKHKSIAKAAIFEAVLNLGLSIALVKSVGIYGVAWGTTLSMAIVHLAFWPLYVRRTLGVSMRIYIWQGWTRITLCAIPFGIVCVVADKYWRASSLVDFFGQILATLPVYAIVVLLVFKGEAGTIFRKWRGARLAQAQVSS